MELLKGIGILMASYSVYSMIKGEVYAKDRLCALWYCRDKEASLFWSICISYVFTESIVAVAISNRLS
ncbi:MAG: hypothetical protein ACI9WR_000015 [Paracoccaceae bacterium]|jgi:hypothetical protein